MSVGLLDGFGSAMAGLSTDEIDAPDAPGALAGTSDEPAVDDQPDLAAAGVGLGLEVPAHAEAARDLAERLLRRSGPGSGEVEPAATWELIGAHPVCTFPVTTSVEIGRGVHETAAPLRLACSCAHVSRRHGEVALDAGGVATVRDLGSANGTVLLRDDEVIPIGGEPVELQADDVIATLDGLRAIATVRRSDRSV